MESLKEDISFSDCDSDDEYLEIDLGDEGSILNQAKNLIMLHDTITPGNAIQLNQRFIEHLESLRTKVMTLIELCDQRHSEIDEILKKKISATRAVTEKKKVNHWQSVRHYGYPFFKAPGGKRAPDNEDQLEKVKRGELLPVDYVYMQRKNWTLLDQKHILDGVKKSMIDFHSQQIQRSIKVLQRRRLISGRLSKIDLLLAEQHKVPDMSFDQLWNCVKGCNDFKIDWDLISMKYLNVRFKAIECQSMWELHLSPNLTKAPWTTQEEDVLLNSVETLGETDWEKIAQKIGNRSEFQCFVHYQTNFGIIRKIDFQKRFTPEEDERILELVKKYRFGDSICWTSLGSDFPGRTKHTLYKRYHYTLNPNIDHSRWTVADDCILMAAIEEYGTNFSKIIQEVMPNRTVPQLRSRYSNSLMSVGNNNIWTAAEDESLVNFYERENKTWSEIANILKTHNRISCRTRYGTIKKFLQSNPQKSVKDVPRKHRRLTTNVTKDNWKEQMQVELHNKSSSEEDPFRETSTIDRSFFKYFMTCFDLNIGEELKPQKPISNNLYHISKMLGLRVTRNQLNLVKHNLTDNQLEELKGISGKFVSDPRGICKSLCLPPNWSTIAAFRGIAITLATHKATSNSSITITNVPEVLDFKARFRKMFYWTALLSRLPRESCNSTVEEVISDDTPENPQPSTSSAMTVEKKVEKTSTQESTPALFYVIEYADEEYVIKELTHNPNKRTFEVADEDPKENTAKRIKESHK